MKSNDNNMNNTNPETSSNAITKAVLDQNNIPIEELLGSVTTYNNVDGSDSKSQQLRTSARVFKKMKLDSTPVVPVVIDKKELIKEEIKSELKCEVKRTVRPSWSQEDKDLFFEALNEYGKDFEAIHSHIINKLKKKGLPDSVMKTKDQIRHFYYRTWHKISKHLKFSDDIKKLVQELYGLINYGELRKKVGSISEKIRMKLNELIYRGAVAIRVRGKTIRIKTPMCRALRKLNQLDEKHDELKLPTRVNIELVPKDMDTWLRVQGMSQNPRIKASVPLQRRLSTLINFLHYKWKTIHAAAYENALITSHPIINDCVPDKKIIEENKAILDPNLRLRPSTKANIELPSFNLSEYLTSQSICLNAFEERIGVKVPGEQLWFGSKGGARRGGTKRARNESSSEKSSPNSQKQSGIQSSTTDNNENYFMNEPEVPSNVDDVIDQAVNTILALQNQETPNTDNGDEKTEEVKLEISEEIKNDGKKEHNVVVIRNGWTFSECGTLSIGELYLMFGSNSSLLLEYSWDHPEQVKSENEVCDTNLTENKEEQTTPTEMNLSATPLVNNVDNNSKITNDSSSSTTPTTTENCSIEDNNNLTTTLQRLLSVAKLHYRKDIVHCPCGHVCGGGKVNNFTKNKTVLRTTKTNSTVAEYVTTVESNVTSVVPIIIQSPAVRPFSPVTVFRRPLSPGTDSLQAQLDRLKPRYCNRRGRRPRSKQVVVERKLPLLPNKIVNGRQIVQMNIISPENMVTGPRAIAPKILNIDKTEHNITNTINIVPTTESTVGAIKTTTSNIGAIDVTSAPNNNFSSIVEQQNITIMNSNNTNNVVSTTTNCNMTTSTSTIDITDNAVTPSRVGSPTNSISNLLDFALAPQSDNMLNNRGIGSKDDSVPSFAGLLSQDMSNTPPTSPSRILKENENQWLNSEVADFSLSSFLGHLESPMKPSQNNSLNAPSEDNHLSQDVDAQLQSLLTETSVDYISQFADLAAQVVSDVKK